MAPDARSAGPGPSAGRRGDDDGAAAAGGRPRRSRALVVTLATVLLVGGGGAVAVGLATQDPAPPAADPAASDRSAGADASPSPEPTVSAAPEPDPTPADPTPADPAPTPEPAKDQPYPTTVRIPSIDVDSDLVTMGRAKDGAIEVPGDADVSVVDHAAWYKGSPRPGAEGPSVILGHVDSINGPSVFHDLGRVEKGDEVLVDRKDGTTAQFVVDHVETYPKDKFPTIDVYRNTDDAELRVITCGGDIDPGTGHYTDNTVVYAHLA
ncbi:class F sortase [Cellulomonas sp. PhB143]|uniref:class F sortase n=1 Tax=Cellulomonas sp. PhB143 TaxID=2485186 RepID=UPI000F47ADB0|nr:class F sortase [Cellulomonas sp. PhB143]ROS73630.1 LPXTG-site transpeptidase (sortase) family protein [Cellulomonas sp. PhB143]